MKGIAVSYGNTLAALFVLAAAPVLAQDVEELIRARVEYLQASGTLEAAGVSIAARNLIPKLYEARAFAPAWRSVAQIDGLLEVIGDGYLEGLNPADYHVDAVRAARDAFADPDMLSPAERAGLDLMLTDSVIRLGYHLRFGKIDPADLDSDWNFDRALMGEDPAVTIQAAIDARSMRAFADEVIPRNFLYSRLRTALAAYRAIAAAGGWPSIEAGPTLKEGMPDMRVPTLIERLAAAGDLDPRAVNTADTIYTGEIAAAVRRFQARHGLTQDGAVGPATRAALNVTVEQRIEQIRVNLERTRWVFGELDDDFLVVNIAGFRLYRVRGEEIVARMRVVVGQPFRRTPVFKATMSYLVFNPTWTVPPTILRQDILPAQRRDPGYLASRDIQLIDDSGMRVDPAAVDWQSRSGFPYRFVQQPGPNNALGRVKFMFPNEHSVYLHDTPSRDLFDRDSRAFSSGCIRVEHPFELALMLLGRGWDQARIDALIASGRSETVFLDDPITVMLLYWTAEVDAEGRVSFLPDVYGRDAAVSAGLAAPFRAGAAL
jgi:murein L,D-transpeptidase YcbB/YkuD